MEPSRTATPGGVTVFGTRLTYRQAAIGAGIVLLVLVLLITLVVQAVGNDDKPSGSTAKGGPTPTTTTPPNSAAPSTSPPTTAPTTTAPAAVTLPAGWKWFSQKASGGAPAFTIPIPKNARISGGGTEMQFRWNNRLLILGRTTSPQPDALEDWKNQEKGRRGTYRDYHFIRLDRVTYRDYDSAADWEFTYTTDSGNPQHVVRRNIRVDGNAAFSLNWYVSTDDWGASQSDLQMLYQGFQPQ